jgi:FkbM family methyltransferase
MSAQDQFRSLNAARFCESTGFAAVDIGARGGLDTAMLPLAWATEMIGFEPEPAEAAALQGGDPKPWKVRRVIAAAVGGVDGTATLHIPPSPESASLLPHNEEMVEWFGVSEQHSIDRSISVETRTLDGLLAEGTLPTADYIKIDVEGAEGAILDHATRYLETTLALRVEVSFLEQRVGQPLGWDVAKLLTDSGFLILDLIAVQRWRAKRLAGHPYRTKADLPYSKPVLAQGDLIAVRDFRRVSDATQAAKLVILTAALGYVDFAATILRHHQAAIAALGLDLAADLRSLSGSLGDAAPAEAIRANLRDLVPLGRSLLGGLPAR